MVEFAWPFALLLFPLPWLLRKLMPAIRQPATALRVPFLQRLHTLPAASNPGSHSLRQLYLLIWALLVLALMRPELPGEPLPQVISGRDVMLAVDLSGSMAFRDMQLNGEEADRLTVLKALLDAFIQRRNGDRMGLILFASAAYVQSPLTHDLDTLRQWLDESFIGLAGRQTALGDAMGLAIKRLQDQPNQNRVLLLITDGANNAGQLTPIQAARLAAAEGIRVFTIGVGADNPQASNPEGQFSFSADPSIDLDEATLQDIALLTDGEYFRAADSDSLQAIYQRIDQLEPAIQQTRPMRSVRPLYHWPVLAALLIGFGFAARRLHAEVRHA
ncbi:vWA domain-containing protein [Halopseudomonas salegens]|uniref:Ca-activated chloride channel family protein n=1 Tax=Halopseudomonas salegens TaxID=1434072 RepID=A0A1H2EYJ6_9GAMM|nr:VWA domain-containing protein [Halopseudomonas salegens]SDU00174.1 Ca-activated chloride channel family protein [Halopseudomonas salegens]